LESFVSKIKSNKGLWFTLLSILSVFGIFISLYFVSYLVEDVADKTYERQKKQYTTSVKTDIMFNKDFVLAIATMTKNSRSVLDNFNKVDENSTDNLTSISNELSSLINQNLARSDIKIEFIKTPKQIKPKVINGIVAQENGTYFISQMPLAQNDTSYLQVSVKQSINILTKMYKDESRDLIYLLNNSSSNRLDSLLAKKSYVKINNNYIANSKVYSKDLINMLQNMDYKEIHSKGYTKNQDMFFVSKKVFDVDGKEIGLIVIAEKIDDNSLIKLVKNLVNNVTMVALGLIVSMILFLF
jgi:hypothetical protein